MSGRIIIGALLLFSSIGLYALTAEDSPYMQPNLPPPNPFPLPESNVWTGSDKETIIYNNGSFDTTPVDTTGTENDIDYRAPTPWSPGWSPPDQ